METIPEGPTIESMNSEVCSTPTSSSNNRNPSRCRRKAIEWHPAEELEERDDNSPNSDKGKPEEPVPDNITTNIETPEDPKPQLSLKKSPSVSFVRDTPPHQVPCAANYDTGYTNPYQRSFEKFFTPNTSFRQPPTSPISVSLAGFESNSATGNPQKVTDIPVIMASGGGGGGNDPPDNGITLAMTVMRDLMMSKEGN
ncbi:hypothetical protein C8R42DRAFT_714985 [Lentinula raphanica]|nr:hypothetical protein C8R42DRAFT_714985 [Lentinula raphanica]